MNKKISEYNVTLNTSSVTIGAICTKQMASLKQGQPEMERHGTQKSRTFQRGSARRRMRKQIFKAFK